MKKQNSFGFLFGVLVTLLAVALIGTAAATVGKQMIEVDYKNIHVVLDYAEMKLSDSKGNTVEPFSYNGTTYIPVRAVSESLGYGVEWHDYGDSASVVVTTPKSALTRDYPFTGAPRLDGIVGNNAFWMSFAAEEGNTDRTYYSYAKSYFKDGTADTYVSLYATALKLAGFKLFQTSTVDGSPMYHYVNDTTKVFVSFYAHEIEGSEFVSVLVNTELQKKDSGSSSIGSGSETDTGPGSSGSAPAPDNSAAYESELAALDAQYNTDQAAIDEDYRQAYITYMRDMQYAGGPGSELAHQREVEAAYQSTLSSIKSREDALTARYNAALAALNAKYGK